MEQAKRRKVEMIAGLVLVILAFLGNGYFFVSQLKVGNGVDISATVFTFLALIMAGVYIGTEFMKSSAKLYKLFLYALILRQLVLLLNNIDVKPLVDIVCDIIGFALINILLWVDDLGKMKSTVLSSLVFASNLYLFICFNFVSSAFGAVNASHNVEILLAGFAQIALPLVLVMMVHLKYVDKEMRKGKNS